MSEQSNPSSETPKGLRYNTNKPPISMFLEARHAVEGASRVLEFGKEKYYRGNWQNGLKHTEVADCLLRHLTAWLHGEDYDKESGEHHADHVLVNALFLSQLVRTWPSLDDRSSPETEKEEMNAE